ncbi:MAG TPA: cytochrome c biogenesis protein ResB [Ruania sp.]|nr:cytochrome c biogenesis protein ResB [Ruania sp.]
MGTYRPDGLKTSPAETTLEEEQAATRPSPAPAKPGGASGGGDGRTGGGRGGSGGGAGGRKRPSLGIKGWLRWIWRQLTSMRVALLLLLLLAAVALPGAFFPQRSVDPQQVTQYFTDHPDLAPVLDNLHLFDVYTSPWFSAVYLLLFISLIGCIVPRTYSHLKNLRSKPTRVPRRFSRFPVRTQLRTTSSVQEVADAVHKQLGRRYRQEWGTETVTTETGRERTIRTISAERGLGRETGNLVFHLALVGLLIVTGWGQLVHYRGQAVIVEGDTFVNSPLDYNSFSTGSWFDADGMEPFRLRLDEFTSHFTPEGAAREFSAFVSLLQPDGGKRQQEIEVNHPLETNSTRVYLTGNGYAPDVTVTDSAGNIAYDGPSIFLPDEADMGYASNGVVMVPDTTDSDRQLGFSGTLLPTAVSSGEGEPVSSRYPELLNPVLVLNVWVGDLGLNDGVPQNLFTLDTSQMTQVSDPDDPDQPLRLVLKPGESVDLPDGLGTVTFNEIPRFAAFDVRYDPSILWMGVFAGIAMAGLAASLFMPRRRIWARLIPGPGGTTVVTAAALARGDDPGLRRELDRVLAPLEPEQDAGQEEKEKP